MSLQQCTGPRVDYVCATCGSHEVKKDAYATWNTHYQIWEICAVFDKGAVCEQCGGETSLREVPL